MSLHRAAQLSLRTEGRPEQPRGQPLYRARTLCQSQCRDEAGWGSHCRKLVAVCCPSVPLCCKEVGSSMMIPLETLSKRQAREYLTTTFTRRPCVGLLFTHHDRCCACVAAIARQNMCCAGRRSLATQPASTAESRSRQIMSAELSYVQLKTANEARVSVSPQPSFS